MVSIIILVQDRLDFLIRCVNSIINNTLNTEYELIFILQNSPQNVVDYVKLLNVNKTFHYFNYNSGVTPGRNKGIELSHGDYLLFFDDDAFVENNLMAIPDKELSYDWLERMLVYFKNDPQVGIVGQSGTYINPQTPGVFWECKTRGAECDVQQGYCFLFSREVFDKIGYLDPYFGKFWHEESEYALRAKFYGFKVINSGYIGVFHLGSGSGDDGTYGDKIRYMFNKWKPHFNKILVPRENWK